MAAQAGLDKTKQKKPTPKSGAGVLVNRSAANINKPLIAMINQLASIDSYLKQQLHNKQHNRNNNKQFGTVPNRILRNKRIDK